MKSNSKMSLLKKSNSKMPLLKKANSKSPQEIREPEDPTTTLEIEPSQETSEIT